MRIISFDVATCDLPRRRRLSNSYKIAPRDEATCLLIAPQNHGELGIIPGAWKSCQPRKMDFVASVFIRVQLFSRPPCPWILPYIRASALTPSTSQKSLNREISARAPEAGFESNRGYSRGSVRAA